MNYDRLESKIQQAVTHMTPDVLDSVLADCKEQKGKIAMTDTKKRNPWKRRVAGIAAALVLLVTGVFGAQRYTAGAVASTISLDVNPSVEIQVNQKEDVLAVNPLNDDGKIVVGDMDFRGSSLDVTVNALIGSMLRNGYLSELNNSILVSVDGKNTSELQARLSEEIAKLLRTSAFDGAVLSQTVAENSDLQAKADAYGITLGKAQLISRIIEKNPLHTFEELAPLTINQLNLMCQSGNLALEQVDSTGSASDKAYIGSEKAKSIALKHASLSASEIAQFEWEMDFEHGVMVYDIEFTCGGYEYDYEINARSGEVIQADRERDNDDDDDYDDNDDDDAVSSGSGSFVISAADAKAAALKHAGLSASQISQYECQKDYENGKAVYEIEFKYNGYEYSYDIDAATGKVAAYDREHDDDAVSANTGTSSSAISAADAKAAALKHAGLSASQISRYEFCKDYENGKTIYEIEFMYNGYEYSYDIDAANGNILHAERELDD